MEFIFFFFLFSISIFFYFLENCIKKSLLSCSISEASAKVQARKRAVARRESSFDACCIKVDDVSSESAAQQTVEAVAVVWEIREKSLMSLFFTSEMKNYFKFVFYL